MSDTKKALQKAHSAISHAIKATEEMDLVQELEAVSRMARDAANKIRQGEFKSALDLASRIDGAMGPVLMELSEEANVETQSRKFEGANPKWTVE